MSTTQRVKEAMAQIELYIPGDPVAQPRVKAVNRGGFTRVYTPTTAKPFKDAIRMIAMAHWRNPPSDRPVAIEIDFYFARPKSMVWKTRPMPSVVHTKKPDLDNLAKAVLDAMNGLVFGDDSQVWRLILSKHYASGDREPHTAIRIEERND